MLPEQIEVFRDRLKEPDEWKPVDLQVFQAVVDCHDALDVACPGWVPANELIGPESPPRPAKSAGRPSKWGPYLGDGRFLYGAARRNAEDGRVIALVAQGYRERDAYGWWAARGWWDGSVAIVAPASAAFCWLTVGQDRMFDNPAEAFAELRRWRRTRSRAG